jgi:aminopeptidase YwaD
MIIFNVSYDFKKKETFMKKFGVFFIVLCLLSCQKIFLDKNYSTDITPTELFSHISFLASDSLKGRKSGTKVEKMAAEYIRQQFQHDRLQLPGDAGFQFFQVVNSIEAGENNKLIGQHVTAIVKSDFVPLAFSENATVTAPFAFMGYGFNFTTDSISWNDYDNIDVSGRLVMILRDHPEIEKPNSFFNQYSELRQKVLIAKDHKAAGVLFVSGIKVDEKDELLDLSFDKSEGTAGIPVIHIKRQLADQILAQNKVTIAQLEQQLISQHKPNVFFVPDTLTLTTEVIKNKSTAQNVIGTLEGVDPLLKDEFILIGAHYDHLGLGGAGSGSRRPDTLAVHNGADDNASGVAALLEIMEKLAAHKAQLKRSVIAVAFSGEELGRVGSKYFIDNPVIDTKHIELMINLDMVGHLNKDTKSLTVGGVGTAVQLSEIVKTSSAKYDLMINSSPEGYGPSDHATFYAEDIPVLFFFTGIHEDYHTPDDDIQKINLAGEQQVANLVYDIIYTVANKPENLTYQEAGPKSMPTPSRRFKVTLGIVPDMTSTNIQGLRVDMVIKNRPAALAGMQKGDIIVAMEGKTVNNIYDYMYRLNEFKQGQRISVEVMRNNEKIILIVEL